MSDRQVPGAGQEVERPGIAYFTGHFPLATHTFFWREITALRKRNFRIDLVSTRRPNLDATRHAWVQAACAETTYLHPLGARGVLQALLAFLRAGPWRWGGFVRALLTAEAPTLRERMRLFGAGVMGARLAWLTRRRGWIHIHVGFTENAANVALLSSCLSGTPYSVSIGHRLHHAGPNQRQKWSRASFGVPNTSFLIAEIKRELAGHLPPILEVAPRGIDAEGYRRMQPFVPWRGAGPMRIFCCGRIVPGKGPAELLHAAAELIRRGIPAAVRIAGDDPTHDGRHRKRILELMEELDLARSVTLLGFITEEEVRQESELAQVFVLPTHDESFGNSVAEAMAMELPVVTSNVGGLPELIDDGIQGLLVPPRDSEALADALEWVARHPDEAVAMGVAGRRKIVDRYYPDRGAEVIESCLIRSLGIPAPVAE